MQNVQMYSTKAEADRKEKELTERGYCLVSDLKKCLETFEYSRHEAKRVTKAPPTFTLSWWVSDN